ncbi:PKD domain-containing protein [Candidatus Bipolaricaulota bacterium]|nr:PKD domain-containing protein [Candidatus Bipolaricaulota bacterium]
MAALLRLAFTGLAASLFALGGAGQMISLSVVSPPRTVPPGEFVIHVFSLRNLAETAMTLSLEVEVPDGWTSLGLPTSLSVLAGDEEVVFFTVAVPRTAPAGSYRVRLWARWEHGEAHAEAEVRVTAVAGVELLPPRGEAVGPGDTVSYDLGLVNRGNVLDRFSADASSAHGWPVRVEPREMNLRPGEKGTIRLVLSVPAGAEPGRDLLSVTVRSGEGAEARAAWFTTVLPPGPEAIVGTVLSELEMRLGGKLGYDPISGRRLSLLTLSGGGEVLGGEVNLLLHLTGPWGPAPYTLSRFSLGYDQGWAWAAVGEVGLDLSSLLLSLGANGMSAGIATASGCAALVTGWRGDEGRFGARGVWHGAWGELGMAVRETRGADHVRAGALWVTGWIADGLAVHGETGLALVDPYRDVALLVGLTATAGTTLDLQADLYAVGPRFPSPRSDRAGISLSGQLMVDPVGLAFTTRWERDNVLDIALVPTMVHSDLTAAVGWSPAGWPAALFATAAFRRNQGFGPGPAVDRRNRLLDLAVTLDYSWLVFRLSGRWRWEEDLIASTSQRIEEYGQRFTLALGQTKAALSLHQAVAYSDGSFAAVANRVGVEWLTPAGLALGFHHASDGGGVGIEIPFAFSPATSITARLDVRWASSGEARALYGEVGFEHGFVATPPFLPVKGWVEGTVFVDENGNGRPDPREPGVTGVVLAVDGTQVSTGADGRFVFPPLAPGIYVLSIDRLPAGVRPQVELPLEVEVVLAGRTIVHIPCERLGEISGVVYDDQDRSGTRDAGEGGLGRVRLVLERDGEMVAEAYTNPLGAFSFLDLPEGEYWVRVDAISLPERHELTTPVAVVVWLPPGATEEVLFGAWQRPRPVVVVYQPPVADFTWEPRVPRAGEPVAFDARASLGEIVNYDWDFTGDGVFDAEGVRVAWMFPEPGFYLVTLLVTDRDGLQDRAELLVQIRP